ncbi:hypothetical protein [Streptomyces sp. RK9]|uniref:hypothetical protein n=1 Tax=Streptomyces sp. RK9 TaxID=3239284 RepID=UPI00386472C8
MTGRHSWPEPASAIRQQAGVSWPEAGAADTDALNPTDAAPWSTGVRPPDIEVTPPNETRSVPLAWPEGAGAIKGAYTDVQVYPTRTTD